MVFSVSIGHYGDVAVLLFAARLEICAIDTLRLARQTAVCRTRSNAGTLQFFLFFLGAKALFKRDWLATLAVVALFVGVRLPGSTHPALDAVTLIAVYLILGLIVYRFGLVALACAIFTVDLVQSLPFTGDFSAWYFGMTAFALLSIIALAGWGFYHSLGERSESADRI